MSVPGYWLYETSGDLKPAVLAFLKEEAFPPAYCAAMRAYLRQWISAPVWRGPTVDELRRGVDRLTSKQAIAEWLATAETVGIDPI